MAHYAYIDENNIVTQVIVGRNENDLPEGVSSWEDYFSSLGKGTCVRTSYNTRGGVHYSGGVPSGNQSRAFRKNYAGIGYTYDPEGDAFIPPRPFESWVLNEETCLWDPPIPYPEDGNNYYWDEESGDWIQEAE